MTRWRVLGQSGGWAHCAGGQAAGGLRGKYREISTFIQVISAVVNGFGPLLYSGGLFGRNEKSAKGKVYY